MRILKGLRHVAAAILGVALLSANTAVYAEGLKVGSIIDYTLYTHIVTYINGYPIQSYNINGYTAVAVEDLANYGFNVSYDDASKVLWLYPADVDSIKPPAFVQQKVSASMVGKRHKPVLFTEIKTRFGTSQAHKDMRSFNIGGTTIVYVDDLSALCGKICGYDEAAKTLTLETIKPWSSVVNNDDWDSQAPFDEGCAFDFEKLEGNSFSIESSSGSAASLPEIALTEGGVSFSYYQSNFGNVNFTNGIINVAYGERVAEDTPERRQELSKHFRVYVNGDLMLGELGKTQGSGHIDYYFRFERLLDIEAVKTIRLELGII
jgi:hypothetical protein